MADELPSDDPLLSATPIDDMRGAPADWRAGPLPDLPRDSKGRVIFCLAAAKDMLVRHPDLAGLVAHDAFTGRVMLTRPIPGAPRENTFRPRELRDVDNMEIVIWFNRNGLPNATRSIIEDAVLAAAYENIINPVRHYLEDLRWDGQKRLSSWIQDYAGAEDTEYVRGVSRAWPISAVARVMDPGCKAEGCLIFEGLQGTGKSTLFRELCGSAYFGDSFPDFGSKDASIYLRGKWIIEFPELSAFSKSDFETIKSFLSRQEERYRPPYGRAEIVEPRRCVFCGTTNRSDYLRDPSGSRRFWPVRTGEIDVEGIRRDRDQLWAEAVHAYQSGERWWLTGQIEAAAAVEQSERNEDDPWRATVIKHCDGREAVVIREILGEAIQLPLERMGRAESLRVAGILAEIGFARDGQFTSGPAKGHARFVRRSGR